MFRILITLIMLTVFSAHAQQPYCNGNTTTTNPDITGGFDWRVNPLNNGNVFIGPQAQQYPFIQYPYTGASTNPNLDIPATPFLKDYKPEDGWELLYYDMGSPGVGTDDPVVFLYNKYRSVIRVFIILLEEEGDGNKAIISLAWEKYNNTKIGTAYLSAYKTPMDALDNFNIFEKKVYMIKPNQYINGDAQWLFADFPIIYDPCVCQNTSFLVVKSTVILEGDINMKVYI